TSENAMRPMAIASGSADDNRVSGPAKEIPSSDAPSTHPGAIRGPVRSAIVALVGRPMRQDNSTSGTRAARCLRQIAIEPHRRYFRNGATRLDTESHA